MKRAIKFIVPLVPFLMLCSPFRSKEKVPAEYPAPDQTYLQVDSLCKKTEVEALYLQQQISKFVDHKTRKKDVVIFSASD